MSKIYVRWGAFQQLAQYRHHCCHKSEKEIAKALDGNYRDEHLFTLKQAVEQYDFYTQQMRTCDELLEAKYGVNVLTAQDVITEIGLDMSKWPTVKHFTSWLSLCPNNQITGGKVKKRGRRKSKNRAAQALRMAAQGLNRSQSALGAY